ncbi:MAG: ATP-binding cassette domain-containing protein [Synergistaceae bacterium]|jgi:molybdate transport system ATP-binding protein|nr:ATP-binding cassette domain-containing protein [Synergistaceae bacterium]
MSIYARIKKNLGSFALDVEFDAADEVMGLLGASGCGKSMTLGCIAGIVRPDEGRIVSDGMTLFDSEKGINLPPQKRSVGLLFQNYALFPNMTVEENVMAVLSRRARKNASAVFRAMAEKFHFAGLEKRYPSQLSGGQQQRVAIARIVSSGPAVIMLDEPLSSLDAYLRWQMESELVAALEEFGGTTLYVTHDRGEIYRVCDKVCVIGAGKSEVVRTVDGLFRSPDTLASARLSGCKNYSRAEPLEGDAIRAVDWGVTLKCGLPADEARFIGVRSHYVSLWRGGSDENTFMCRVLRVKQDVFSTVAVLRPENAKEGAYSKLVMEFAKGEYPEIKDGGHIKIAIRPADIMPLSK